MRSKHLKDYMPLSLYKKLKKTQANFKNKRLRYSQDKLFSNEMLSSVIKIDTSPIRERHSQVRRLSETCLLERTTSPPHEGSLDSEPKETSPVSHQKYVQLPKNHRPLSADNRSDLAFVVNGIEVPIKTPTKPRRRKINTTGIDSTQKLTKKFPVKIGKIFRGLACKSPKNKFR